MLKLPSESQIKVGIILVLPEVKILLLDNKRQKKTSEMPFIAFK